MPRACANAGASNTAKNSRIHRSMAQFGYSGMGAVQDSRNRRNSPLAQPENLLENHSDALRTGNLEALVGIKDALVLILMLMFFAVLYAGLSAKPAPVTAGFLRWT